MNKQEFYGASLPHKLKVFPKDSLSKILTLDSGIYEWDFERGITNHIPIIRHFDDLTKECTQSDYNEGNPFIPMLELAKMKGWSWGVIKDGKCYVTQILYGGTSFTETFHYSDNEGFYTITDDDYYTGDEHKVEKVGIKFNHFLLYQQLLKWHFWPNMPEGEKVVLVTKDFNPYK